jgi:uncharacterized RDD family membrane protein YckC
MVLAVGSTLGSSGNSSNPEALLGMMVLIFGSLLVLYPLALFPYWMCGLDKEKRTLHDRVCATRVVKKKVTG